MPQRFEAAKNALLLHGMVIEIDDAGGKAIKIQRVLEAV
jgi:calcineurin-like phosphoesterase